jgi:hypothetical protein
MIGDCDMGQIADASESRSISIPVKRPRSRFATSRRSSRSLVKLSSPTTFVVQANVKKHLETVPTRAMVNLDAARHGKLGADRSALAIKEELQNVRRIHVIHWFLLQHAVEVWIT